MSSPPDGPPIPLHRLILLPLALLGGFVIGSVVGAVYLPYLVLNEIVRKIGQSWSYLDGWAEWAERGGRGVSPKPGWMAVWVLWVIGYIASALSWAPAVGMAVGPFLLAYLVLVPDGLDRMLQAAKHGVARFRRMQIKIVDPAEDEQAA